MVRGSEPRGNPGLAIPFEPGAPEGQRERWPVSFLGHDLCTRGTLRVVVAVPQVPQNQRGLSAPAACSPPFETPRVGGGYSLESGSPPPHQGAIEMQREILWTDAEEIGIQLQEKFPDLDPLTVRFTDLHRYVTELEGFADDPVKSNESRLEAIQMAWHEEFQDAQG